MKLVLYLLLLFTILLSACSGKRYGHYSYSKRHNKKISEFRKKKVKANTLSFIKAGNYKTNSDTLLKLVSVETKVKYFPATNNTSEKHKGKEEIFVLEKLQPKSNEKHVAKPNVNADVSMALGIVSIFFGLFSLLYLPLLIGAFTLGLLAYDFAVKALEEMDDNPEKYSNKNAAIVGKIIGGIYRYAIILALAILALAVMAGVVLLLGYMIVAIA